MSDMATPAEPAGVGGGRQQVTVASLLHPLTRALLVLTFTTGVVDAVSYLALGRVFTANMTGNIVLLGFGVAGAGGLPVLSPIVSLAFFLLGAVAGGRLALRVAERQHAHIAFALTCEVILITVAAILAAVLTVRPRTFAADVIIALLAFSMGVRNATVRRLGVPDMTTTVLTMTLTAFAVESPLGGGSGKGSVRRTGAVVAMFAGALVGALLLKTSIALALALAAAAGLIAGLAYVPLARRAE